MKVNTTSNHSEAIFLSRWPRFFAVASCIFIGIFLLLPSSLLLSTLFTLFFSAFIYTGRCLWKPLGTWGGAANAITALRTLGILLLLFFQAELPPAAFFVVGILILIADGLDGYYARKYNTVSAFGDLFDKETDAFFVLAFCIILIKKELIGMWVVWPALLRYIFVLVLHTFRIQHIVLSYSFRRQFIGMWFMGTIMACFVLPRPVYTAGMIFATAMLAYSFMKDTFLMLKLKSDQG
ncbi:CDP-alcohol phosphatidyltransferase family protein [Porifericola rhodea]|uniref:CDP-alcohol phosphatidyltransferase family protein n=1 Tax=Porifericola rhodea TaxID=930972 RepID=UPI002665F7B5|nr:CDP-alcohol phosphatidyltransferase family protein [Porifericola rhodea]WKN31911.1 CDP-alcohol phosphatidyltransferase family protein [Porifericola rhodea]